jgi:hypothetical protein
MRLLSSLLLGFLFFVSVNSVTGNDENSVPEKIYLIDTTDLYHPGEDLGDNFDIIAPYALEEIVLRTVILDVTEDKRFHRNIGRDMGIIPVTQLNYIFDRNVEAAPSPFTRMRSVNDQMIDIPVFQQTGIELFLKTLRESKEKMDVTVFGSARTVAVAYNREPELLRQKIRLLHLSIGTTTSVPPYFEWNVKLDPNALVTLLRSDLPMALYPCAANNDNNGDPSRSYDSNNGYWCLKTLDFIPKMDVPIRRYFEYAFSYSQRSDFLRTMEEDTNPPFNSTQWNRAHNVWETCVWLCMTGRVLVQHKDGNFRIIRKNEIKPDDRILPNELRPCKIKVQNNGLYSYEYTTEPTHIWIYYRGDPKENETALRAALPALYLNFKATIKK